MLPGVAGDDGNTLLDGEMTEGLPPRRGGGDQLAGGLQPDLLVAHQGDEGARDAEDALGHPADRLEMRLRRGAEKPERGHRLDPHGLVARGRDVALAGTLFDVVPHGLRPTLSPPDFRRVPCSTATPVLNIGPPHETEGRQQHGRGKLLRLGE